MRPFVALSILSITVMATGCSTVPPHNSNQTKTIQDSSLHNGTNTTQPSSSSVTYTVNGQTVLTGAAVNDSASATAYLPLSDIEAVLSPTLHVEADKSGQALNLTGTWEPNPFNRLPNKEGTSSKHAIALEVNGHPYVIGKSVTRSVKGKQVTYISADDLASFLRRALNVHASWHTNRLSLQIGHTIFSYQGYTTVKPGETVPSYASGDVGMSTFPDTTKNPIHGPWHASALGVASAFTWNVVPPGYGWAWTKGSVSQKNIQSTDSEILASYNGVKVEYKLVQQYPATSQLPAIAIVDLTVGKTGYRIQLYRPNFTYAWAIYDEIQYQPITNSLEGKTS